MARQRTKKKAIIASLEKEKLFLKDVLVCK